MPLADTAVRQARPKEKEYKLPDERGLLLLVRPNGGKWWRLRYQFQGTEKMISLGVYPDVSLSMARERRDAARRLLADGKDPSAERQAEKRAREAAGKTAAAAGGGRTTLRRPPHLTACVFARCCGHLNIARIMRTAVDSLA